MIAAAAVLGLVGGYMSASSLQAAKEDEKMLVHNVFFTLKDPSKENVEKLTENCKKYLIKHDGVAYFGVGPRCEELDREVNAKDFHFALHLVFKNKAAHDKYQDAPDHLKFIEESKDLWSKVRVYDNYLSAHETPGK
jgi:quinol monooxygenase YgiN